MNKVLVKIRNFTLDSAHLLLESLVTLQIQSQENAPYNKSTPAPSPTPSHCHALERLMKGSNDWKKKRKTSDYKVYTNC